MYCSDADSVCLEICCRCFQLPCCSSSYCAATSSFSGSLWFFTLQSAWKCDGWNSDRWLMGAACCAGNSSSNNSGLNAWYPVSRIHRLKFGSSWGHRLARFCPRRSKLACSIAFACFLYLAFCHGVPWSGCLSCSIWNFCCCFVPGQRELGVCVGHLWLRRVHFGWVHASCLEQRLHGHSFSGFGHHFSTRVHARKSS